MDLQQSSNPATASMHVKLEIKTEPGIDPLTIKTEPGQKPIKSEPIDPLNIKQEPKMEIKQEDVKPPIPTSR